MPSQIARPDTAFSLDRRSRQRSPRKTNNAHLAFIRRLPSLVPGAGDIEAAHVRYGEPRYGKRQTGMGERPSDCWVVPLAHQVHQHEQHRHNERQWWIDHGIDPLLIAALLYAHSGNDDAGIQIIRNAKLIGRGQ